MTNMIFKRTSVRKYKTDALSAEQIELLMKAGMAAPSGCNAQPWEFIVIQDRENLLKITQIHPYSQMLKQAPLAILVCADTTKIPCAVPNMLLWPQDCAAATENIMLQATEMGLGSVWMGVYPNEEIIPLLAKEFDLPEHVKPFSIIAIGYPDGEFKPKDKFDPKKIHYEKWTK